MSVSLKRPLHHPSDGPPPRAGEVFDSEPPRDGEGDRRTQSGGGGVLSASTSARKVAKRERRSGNLPEVLIWRELRKRPGGCKFRRQHPLSEVVLDFACLERRVAIEIDGEVHNRGDRPERDLQRDAYLAARGFLVLRLPARFVLTSLEDAIATIVAACDERLPHHHSAAPSGPAVAPQRLRLPRAGEVLTNACKGNHDGR